MASYLRPRRGKKATAESQAIVLKRGEVFFECPDAGVGTGKGKIKVGDGATAYASLPYFMENFDLNASDSTIAFTDCSSATASSNNATYLSNIKPANSLVTIFTNLKQLLYNYNSEITQLNNDLDNLYPVGCIIHSTTCSTMALVVNTYGGTTWIQHTGYVLRGASSGVVSRNATATGGSDTITPSGTVGGHTLTNSEIPSHNHGTANSGGSFLSAGVSGSNIQLGGTGTFGGIAINGSTASTGGGGSHSHGLTMNSHTNLPSYKSVYIWERTA